MSWEIHKLRTCSLQGVVEGKVFIVDMRESAPRDIWKNPERERRLNMSSRLDWAMEGGEQDRGKREGTKRGRQKRNIAEIPGL